MTELPQFVEMTDERFVEIARRFGVSVEEVRAQWEVAQANGPEATIAEMDEHLAEMEADMDEVVAGVDLSGDRRRAMNNLYGQLVDLIPDGKADVPDLLLKMSIMLYKLAEAQVEITRLRNLLTGTLDGNRRSGSQNR